jgi:anti-sigma regulatory factor (Ser/Thr protein kinase)
VIDTPVTDTSHVAEARRLAAAAAAGAGAAALAGPVALAATELATNLLKHGGGGRLLVDAHAGHVDLLALDRGAGMRSVPACLADGFSTAGSLGHGLGALQRLSRQLEVVSWPGGGTAVFACIAGPADAAHAPDAALHPHGEPAAVSVAKPGEPVCGDAWSAHVDAGGRTLFMVDGLGHGSEAALAANEAVRQFQRSRGAAPQEIVHAVHGALRPTRGGAVAVARIHWGSGSIEFAGLGNIAAAVVGAGAPPRRMVSHNGTAGHSARKIQAFHYPAGDGVVVLHSDGIGSRWTLDRYPGLAVAHPMLIAGVLYRDHARGRDDATVLACPVRAPGAHGGRP